MKNLKKRNGRMNLTIVRKEKMNQQSSPSQTGRKRLKLSMQQHH